MIRQLCKACRRLRLDSMKGTTQLSSPPTLRALYGIRAPAMLRRATTALVLVDFQDEFVHGRLPLPDAPLVVESAKRLLGWARESGVTVIHVLNVVRSKDSPVFAPDSAGADFIAALEPRPGEEIVTKAGGGAFTKTPLDACLRSHGIETVIVAGLMTHLAVHLSAADASVLGYRTIVVSDATATRDLPVPGGGLIDHRTLQAAALASIGDRFADVMTVAHVESLVLGAAPRPIVP